MLADRAFHSHAGCQAARAGCASRPLNQGGALRDHHSELSGNANVRFMRTGSFLRQEIAG